jgi:hypothetical protein
MKTIREFSTVQLYTESTLRESRVLDRQSGCGRETDSPLEGAGFEPSVPRKRANRCQHDLVYRATPRKPPSRSKCAVARCGRSGMTPNQSRLAVRRSFVPVTKPAALLEIVANNKIAKFGRVGVPADRVAAEPCPDVGQNHLENHGI